MRILSRWLMFGCCIVATVGAMEYSNADLGRGTRVAELSVAAELSVVSLNGTVMHEQFARNTVVMLFAPWCEYSAYAASYIVPSLILHVQAAGGDALMVDVSRTGGLARAGPLGMPDSGIRGEPQAPISNRVDSLRAFSSAYLPGVPLYYQDDDIIRQRFPLYDSGVLPTFIFIRAGGRVVTRAEGVSASAALAKTFDELLGVKS